MFGKTVPYFIVVVVTCLLVQVNQLHAQHDTTQISIENDFALLNYPDVTYEYQDFALSFDSLFERTDHTPYYHYFNEEDVQLSLIHELINDAPDGSVIEIPEGEYICQYFSMENRHDLILKAKPGTVWLISDDVLSTIFYMVNCTNITLQGIGFLHRTEGFCSGNSLEIRGCRSIVIDSCDISGSGTIGVVADFVDSLIIQNSYVHHCTYQIIQLTNVRNVILFNNLFSDNKEHSTITEGVTVANIWGKCIIQNNSFYDNRCAALVFNILKQEDRECPVGDGHVYVRRNLFYNNISHQKLAGIYDVFFDGICGKYAVLARDMVSFSENYFNRFDSVPAYYEESYYVDGEYYIYPEIVDGDFDLTDNFFREIEDCGYNVQIDSFVIGIHPSAINWMGLSRNPEPD